MPWLVNRSRTSFVHRRSVEVETEGKEQGKEQGKEKETKRRRIGDEKE